MSTSSFRIILTVFLLGFIVMPAEAKDKEVDATAQSVHERLDAFTADFGKNEKKHFMAMYGSYNLISVVNIVRTDVEEAIEKCADKNPDMKDALKSRYKDWDASLEPVMDEAQGNLDNMIKVQDYAKEGDIEDFFEFLDEQREAKTEDIKKVPVTTPEACEHLRSAMDKTQEQLIALLRSTLVSVPQEVEGQIKEEIEKAEAAEAAAKAKAKEEAKAAEAEEKAAAEKAKADADAEEAKKSQDSSKHEE